MKDFFSKYWFLSAIIIILIIGTIFFYSVPVIQENPSGGILAFVGILATFIVISNYAQIKDFENRIKDIETKLSKTNKEKNDLEERIEGIEKDKQHISDAISKINQGVIIDLERLTNSEKTDEEKIEELYNYFCIDDIGVRRKIFEIIQDISNRFPRNLKLSENIFDITLTFHPEKPEIDIISEIIEMACNMTYNSFKQDKVAPARWALLIIKYINILAKRDNYDAKIIFQINEAFKELKRHLNREDWKNKKNIDNAKEMLQTFKEDLSDNTPTMPVFSEKLQKCIDKEEKELGIR